MLMSEALCAHISALNYGMNIPLSEEVIQAYIGKLNSMSVDTMLTYSADLKRFIASLFDGSFKRMDVKELGTIGFKKNTDRVVFQGFHEEYIPEYVPKDPYLLNMGTLDLRYVENQKYLTSHMRLKSFIPPRGGKTEPSRKQILKAYNSITEPFNGNAEQTKVIAEAAYTLTRNFIKWKFGSKRPGWNKRHYEPFTHQPVTEKKINYILPNGCQSINVARNNTQSYSLLGFLRQRRIKQLWLDFPDEFATSLFYGVEVKGVTSEILDNIPISDDDAPLSWISFIGESGDKERVVAVPTSGLQALSFPLGKLIKTLNSSWAVQGVDSHDNACRSIMDEIQGYTNSGHIFSSVDMTSFTDRFPYHQFQRHILLALRDEGYITDFDIHVMDIICESPINFRGYKERYGVGTPMGTYPSFPLASFANGIVSTIAYCDSNELPYEDFYSFNSVSSHVVGDDIVIRDAYDVPCPMSLRYKQIMTSMGVPIQESKCMTSYDCAEFCSKIITAQGVFQQRKGDALYSFEDLSGLIDIYRFYDDPILEFLQLDNDILSVILNSRFAPFPYGSGPPLDDPYWENRETEKLIWNVIQESSKLSIDNSMINSSDYNLIGLKRSQIPKDLRFESYSQSDEPKRVIYDPFIAFTLEFIQQNVENILSHNVPLYQKVDYAQQIKAIIKAVDRCYGEEDYLYKMVVNTPQDSHLLALGKSKSYNKNPEISDIDCARFANLGADIQDSPKGGDYNELE